MIDSVKELERLVKLCRKNGIYEMDFHGVAFKMGDAPVDHVKGQANDEAVDPYANFPTGELTPEQLMFYSSGGILENDPSLKSEAV